MNIHAELQRNRGEGVRSWGYPASVFKLESRGLVVGTALKQLQHHLGVGVGSMR